MEGKIRDYQKVAKLFPRSADKISRRVKYENRNHFIIVRNTWVTNLSNKKITEKNCDKEVM